MNRKHDTDCTTETSPSIYSLYIGIPSLTGAAVRKVVTYRIRQYVLRCISINLIADACEQFLIRRLWFVWIEFQSDRRACLVSYRTSCSRQSRLLAPILNEWGYQSTTWKPAFNNCYRDIIKNTECKKTHQL